MIGRCFVLHVHCRTLIYKFNMISKQFILHTCLCTLGRIYICGYHPYISHFTTAIDGGTKYLKEREVYLAYSSPVQSWLVPSHSVAERHRTETVLNQCEQKAEREGRSPEQEYALPIYAPVDPLLARPSLPSNCTFSY